MLMGSSSFDPKTVDGGLVENGFSQTHFPNCSPNFSMEDHSSHQNPFQQQQQEDAAAAAMEMGLQTDSDLMQQMVHESNQGLSCDQTSWEHMTFTCHHQQDRHQNMQQVEVQKVQQQSFTNPLSGTPCPPTSDLINMLPLPRCSASSFLPNSSISFANSSTQMSSNYLSSLGLVGDFSAADGAPSSVVYDPLLPLNLPPHPPLLRELIQSLPHGYNLGGLSGGSLFSGVDDGEAGGSFFQDEDGRSYDNGVYEFTADMNSIPKGREGKHTKHFATEKQRRVQFNDKYTALKNLLPNPTKADRASIVGDAIEYINELKRTVDELKILAEKKRCRERFKRLKLEDGADGTVNVKTEDDPYHGSALRSSWLHRKSKNNEVDVHIIDDEVTVKFVQQKRINCLLFVSKVLDELHLDLHHVAGGLIGDYYSFLFNSKISEGSTVYAHAIANKLIEVVDKQCAAVQPTSSY